MTKLGLEDVPLSNAIVNATRESTGRSACATTRCWFLPCSSANRFWALAYHILQLTPVSLRRRTTALHDYRQENDVEDAGRPMPDLKVSDGACEVPLWFDDLADGHRERATLIDVDGRWAIVGE